MILEDMVHIEVFFFKYNTRSKRRITQMYKHLDMYIGDETGAVNLDQNYATQLIPTTQFYLHKNRNEIRAGVGGEICAVRYAK